MRPWLQVKAPFIGVPDVVNRPNIGKDDLG